MEKFAEKLKDARVAAGLTQGELAQKLNLSLRTIQAYEHKEKEPRRRHLYELARILNVSTTYLCEDSCTDRRQDIALDECVLDTEAKLGNSAAGELEDMLRKNTALFAGGELTEQQKDEYFFALSKAYMACKLEARKRYGKKSQ